jgi:hypothetical protein
MALNASLLDNILQKYVGGGTESADKLQAASFIVKGKDGSEDNPLEKF